MSNAKIKMAIIKIKAYLMEFFVSRRGKNWNLKGLKWFWMIFFVCGWNQRLGNLPDFVLSSWRLKFKWILAGDELIRWDLFKSWLRTDWDLEKMGTEVIWSCWVLFCGRDACLKGCGNSEINIPFRLDMFSWKMNKRFDYKTCEIKYFNFMEILKILS